MMPRLNLNCIFAILLVIHFSIHLNSEVFAMYVPTNTEQHSKYSIYLPVKTKESQVREDECYQIAQQFGKNAYYNARTKVCKIQINDKLHRLERITR